MKRISQILIITIAIAVRHPALASDKSAAAAVNTICPVSGDSIDKEIENPVTVIYKGQTIMLCCKTCLRKFKANPEKYAAILNQRASKK